MVFPVSSKVGCSLIGEAMLVKKGRYSWLLTALEHAMVGSLKLDKHYTGPTRVALSARVHL